MKKIRMIPAGFLLGIVMIISCACTAQESVINKQTNLPAALEWEKMEKDHSMKLEYAEQFSVDYYQDGYALIDIKDSGRFFVVPENTPVPTGLEEDITVLQQPLNRIYLVATSAMDLFRALDGLDSICLSGTDAKGWYVKEAREAMEAGSILYAGKYSAPDYELILSKQCNLAVQSTMIYHTPEVKEQLEGFGIPVLVERSSYESHPLGRMEWLKLYSVLLDKESEAEQYFNQQSAKLQAMEQNENTKKTVAFFYINSNGSVNVRKSGDYVAKMIELAGGNYVPSGLQEENALSTVNMQMEAFYAQAKDADYLIYNSTIDGEIKSIDELLQKSELLKEFKAVKEKNTWCIQKNMFQQTTGIGDMILDNHKMIMGEAEEWQALNYMYKLR